MSSTGWSFTLDLGSWNHPDITKLVHLVVRTVHFLVWKQCCRSPSRSHWRSSLYRLQESESLSFLLSDCFLLAPNRSAPMVKYWRDTSLMALSMKLVTVREILHPHATSLICQHEASKLPFQFYHREKKKKRMHRATRRSSLKNKSATEAHGPYRAWSPSNKYSIPF